MSSSAFVTRDDGSVVVYQDAADRLDYGIDHARLLRNGDTIKLSTWSAVGGVVISDEGVAGSVVVAMLEGTNGIVRNHVTTESGLQRVTTFCVEPPPTCA